MPTTAVTDSVATAARAASGARLSRATLISSGSSASPTPCMARPASISANGSGNAASTLPASRTTSAVSSTCRRHGPSPSFPTTGDASAPTSRVSVTDHCALPRLTS